MDPLSLTASIITVVGLAGSIGKSLKQLRQLRHIPDEVHTLINDIADLQAVLAEVERVLIQYQATTHIPDGTVSYLSKTIELIRLKLSDLDRIAAECGGVEFKVKIARLKWVRARTKVVAIQASLRELKMNLITTLGTLCS